MCPFEIALNENIWQLKLNNDQAGYLCKYVTTHANKVTGAAIRVVCYKKTGLKYFKKFSKKTCDGVLFSKAGDYRFTV